MCVFWASPDYKTLLGKQAFADPFREKGNLLKEKKKKNSAIYLTQGPKRVSMYKCYLAGRKARKKGLIWNCISADAHFCCAEPCSMLCFSRYTHGRITSPSKGAFAMVGRTWTVATIKHATLFCTLRQVSVEGQEISICDLKR